jgi:small subunit ribosomal protein S16
MAIVIRLTRGGKKKKPFYRIVATNSTSKRDGKFLEILGTYDPMQDPAEIRIHNDRVKKWLERGAKPSDTVKSLLKKAAVA